MRVMNKAFKEEIIKEAGLAAFKILVTTFKACELKTHIEQMFIDDKTREEFVLKFYSKDGFDYIEVDADYKAGVNIPPTFKGFSGGGLWQIIPSESKLNPFLPGKFLLSGITFAQSSVLHEHRTITCHGRLSIYKKAFEVLVN